MTFEDAKRNWREEVNRPPSAEEIQGEFAAIQSQCDQLERAIRQRDVSEIVTAVFVIAVFAVMWPVYRHYPTAVLGVAVIMLGGVLAIFVLLRARKSEPRPFDASVLDCSRQRLAWLDVQIRLLETVAWWYVPPFFVGVLLFAWGQTRGKWLPFGMMVLVELAVSAWVIVINKRAVRQKLLPFREEVARVVEDLGTSDRS